MRRNARIIRTAVAALLAAAVPGGAQTAVRLEEVLSIGGPASEALFQWTGLATDDQGALYVLDAMDFAVKKFDARGRLLNKAGRRGQGPGEFTTPRWLAVDGENVYAVDQSVAGLLVFDRDLVYLKTIPLPGLVEAVEARPGGGLAVVVSAFDAPGRVLFLDPDGRTAGELRYREKREGFLLDTVSLALAPGGAVYLGFLFQDRIERWDLSAGRSWSRSLFGGKASETTNVRGFALPKDTFILDIAVDSLGRVYALGGKQARNRARDVFVLDASGALTAVLTLPQPSHCLHFDSRDFLYVRAEEGTALKKFRLVFD
ncbi:MAG: 6-bladed beta-propeller [Candidatus Aminicenantes bacterium]|nr:6-bladed beta-propeller [Candidatus Aminicenantes bacterium]